MSEVSVSGFTQNPGRTQKNERGNKAKPRAKFCQQFQGLGYGSHKRVRAGAWGGNKKRGREEGSNVLARYWPHRVMSVGTWFFQLHNTPIDTLMREKYRCAYLVM